MRYFFEVSYVGTRYAGWQSQNNALGVQAVIENALSTLLREAIAIVGSGRTDAGVHCEQQFFHADISKSFEAEKLQVRLNAFLPPDISIKSIRAVIPEAHARYSARARTYEYRICLGKDPFLEGFALRWHRPLDIQTMNRAAALIVGTHDFTAFSKVKTDVNHFICEVRSANWKLRGNILTFRITANRFLRGMVRALVGTLLDVGSGKMSVAGFADIIKAKDRRKAGANAPPHGLFLMRVTYPRSVFVSAKSNK
ncbi:MAG TPA: tRNA pseudouridine(38-40) synthase TruA [Cyclobacteriaceae bacterium]|nr:MAG: tRNA pseudouridine(38-40) synthase TruA [Bacteroidota bacterium]HLT81045.1 tRNA pseudouridine(38-40) synthase TruA [Cyclobacteriaceae bacterium]